jgi:hypothetical protein
LEATRLSFVVGLGRDVGEAIISVGALRRIGFRDCAVDGYVANLRS